ncbi:phosphocholine-specific phospholipase C [Granulicella cerasi]|uniref:phosphocholine-specific phospholipase C n=1 Tax=Granulicella cerasi TaxID=741063 RepID=UPI0021E002AE|nr:phospholipase C, phosphocholine-specific [Granulicella cerasi]
MQTRRDFLKKASMLAGATGFAAGVPLAVQKAFAIAPDPGTTWKAAEHVVILMQENRSFDHALGTLQGVRGFNDPRATRQANGQSVFLQTSLTGETYMPWRLDIKDTKITWMGSIPHSRNSQVDAWNHGHHNAWIDAKRSSNADYRDVPITMGHYTREDIPFYYALADAFTVCDQHYCGAMTSTTPNRSLLWTGTVRDEQKATSAVYMRNPEFSSGHLKWKTFPERLTEAGVNWNCYQNEINVATFEEGGHDWLGNVGNVLEHFAAYNVNLSNASTKKLQKNIADTQQEIAALQQKNVDPTMKDDLKAEIEQKQAHLQALQALLEHGGSLSNLSATEQELHMRAFTTNAGDEHYHSLETLHFEDGDRKIKMDVPKGDVLYQFRKDVNEGTLPMVSWLVPPGKFSDHPSHPWYGAWFLSEAVDILTKNPEVWKKTIFILLYDENDGYFDHAPSFTAAEPGNRGTGRASEGIDTALEYTYHTDEIAQGVKPKDARSGPIGLGFRVPMIVASPWSRGGWVNSEVCDTTSVIQFLEAFVEAKTGKTVKETNVSEYRRAICGDLTSVFRPADHSVAQLPFLDRDKFVEGIEKARYKEIPSNFQKLTAEQMAAYNADRHKMPGAAAQEKGIRNACALPYEMYCEGSINAEHKVFSVAMRAGNTQHGARSAGVPFNVYLRNTSMNSGVAAHGDKNQNMFVASYAVRAGDTLRENYPLKAFKDGRYEIDVHGPNGFYRSFRGNVAEVSPMSVACAYENATGLTGNVHAKVKNTSTKPVTVTVVDHSYGQGTQSKQIDVGQSATLTITSSKSHGWYDFTVKSVDSEMAVHYAGHVDTGKSSFTDPLMGGMVEV